jgi:hypothetical protein
MLGCPLAFPTFLTFLTLFHGYKPNILFIQNGVRFSPFHVSF